MIFFRIMMEILVKKYPSIKAFDQQKLSELKVALLSTMFNEDENCPLSLHAICADGQANHTGDVGKYWKSNYTLFCMKRLCEKLKEM